MRRLAALLSVLPLAPLAAPLSFAVAAPPLLPLSAANREALAPGVDGVEIETLPGGYMVVALSNRAPTLDATDPLYKFTARRLVGVYKSEPGGALTRLVAVRYDDADRDDALRCARLIARLLRLHQERLGEPTEFPSGAMTADVWLRRDNASDATIGGETRAGNVYIFGTSSPRSPREWARTIAHEWGHLTLPAARGFSSPETDAGGELGERLHTLWLRDDLKAGVAADDFCAAGDLDGYIREKVTPRIDDYLRRGPADSAMNGHDADTMMLYIGAALSARQSFGDRVLGRALYGIDSEAPRALLDSLRRAVYTAPALTVNLPAWVPLAADSYRITPASGGGSGKLAIADRPPFTVAGSTPFAVKAPGWKKVKAATPTLTAVIIHKGPGR